MHRRHFLASSAALAASAAVPAAEPKLPTPADLMKNPRERFLFVTCVATDPKQPDYLAVVDADPASPTYSKVVRRLAMPHPGDELHHFGWNICSSCHGDPGDRRYLIVPGLKSSRIHVIDAKDPLNLRMHKVIEPDAVKKLGLSAPHTVHCLPTGEVMLSMLGNAGGDAPGGFLLLDDKFDIKGRWEKDAKGFTFNYDFWYQPRLNLMVSTEWAAPNTYLSGFDPKDVAAGKYGSRLHFWDWKGQTVSQTFDLGDAGRIPLEVRFKHDPNSTVGFVGAALSSSVWWIHPTSDVGVPNPAGGKKEIRRTYGVKKVIEVDPVKAGDQPLPGLITDILVSMDDRFLYFSNWLHGDIRQYDIRDPQRPKLAGQLFLGGLIGKAREVGGKKLGGGPQMLQLSLDGKRLYVTNSLLAKWDDQFYPDMRAAGSWLLQIDCDPEKGGMTLNDKFAVDFGAEPTGPARAHEVRYPGGDCTSDIFS